MAFKPPPKIYSFTLLALHLLLSTSPASSNDPIQIDTDTDIEGQPNWAVNCLSGYSESVSDFSCNYGGAVDIPAEDLAGQVGFWTQCGDLYSCRIKYTVQPGDTSFAVRVYQRNSQVGISVNGGSWELTSGEGWTEINKAIESGDTTIDIRLAHFSGTMFAVLDKISVNGELPPLIPEPPSTTTEDPDMTTISSGTSPEESTTTETPESTTPAPVEREVCPAYPNATEHANLFPHTDNIISTSCGALLRSSGGIFYKPFEPILANERCVWTVAVPNAKGYGVAMLFFGYQPTENNEDDHGLIISEFGAGRSPTHFIPTTTDMKIFNDTNMLVITFITGPNPTSDQKGFALQINSRMDGVGELIRPVNPLSKHFLVGHQQYYVAHELFYPFELSSYVFLPREYIYRPDKENRVVYKHGPDQNCATDHLKVYLFNTTCVGPNKWQYQGQLCGTTPTTELIKSPEPILIVFETSQGTDLTNFTGPDFVYSASC